MFQCISPFILLKVACNDAKYSVTSKTTNKSVAKLITAPDH